MKFDIGHKSSVITVINIVDKLRYGAAFLVTINDMVDGCIHAGNPCEANEECDVDTDTCVPVCTVDVLTERLPKSNLFLLYPLGIRIRTTGIELSRRTPVNIVCGEDSEGILGASVLKTGRLALPILGEDTTRILQTIAIWPAWWTQSLGEESETCTVTVGDCPDKDTFDLDYLSLGNFPLSE